jgi:hypothetical protein
VGEAVGHRVALGLLLQRVVADRRGGAQRLLHVAGLEDAAGRVGVLGPHAGQAVGLQLEAHRQLVGLRSPARWRAACTFSEMPSRFCTWWPTSWAIT